MIQQKNKLKHDVFEKKPRHKGCLAQTIAINLIWTGSVALMAASEVAMITREYSITDTFGEYGLYVYLLAAILLFGSAIGLACWKDWAYYGTFICNGFFIVLTIAAHTFTNTFLFGSWTLILFLTLYPIRRHFD